MSEAKEPPDPVLILMTGTSEVVCLLDQSWRFATRGCSRAVMAFQSACALEEHTISTLNRIPDSTDTERVAARIAHAMPQHHR